MKSTAQFVVKIYGVEEYPSLPKWFEGSYNLIHSPSVRWIPCRYQHHTSCLGHWTKSCMIDRTYPLVTGHTEELSIDRSIHVSQ